jgi:hypothetical protein
LLRALAARSAEMQQPETTLKLLVGVEAIAAFVFGEATPANVRRARHWIDTGRLPAGKVGNRYIGDQGVIAKRMAEVTAGGAK